MKIDVQEYVSKLCTIKFIRSNINKINNFKMYIQSVFVKIEKTNAGVQLV